MNKKNDLKVRLLLMTLIIICGVFFGYNFGQYSIAEAGTPSVTDTNMRFDKILIDYGVSTPINDFTVDSSGNVYVVDMYSTYKLRKYNSSGALVWQKAPAELSCPIGICVDSTGNIFVSDYGTHAIYKFNSSGDLIVTNNDFSYISMPYDLIYGNDGLIYAIDSGNKHIIVLGTELELVDLISVSDLLSNPISICMDSSNNFYIGDQYSGLIAQYDYYGVPTGKSYQNTTVMQQIYDLYCDGTDLYASVLSPDNKLVKLSTTDMSYTYQWLIPGNNCAQKSISGNILVVKMGPTYTIVESRVASSNNSLSSLAITGYDTFASSFSSSVTGYSMTVLGAVDSITLTPTAADSKASITINSSYIASGTSRAVALAYGDNNIEIKVTAESGAVKTYTITVNRNASTNNNLSSLAIAGHDDFASSFSSAVTTYDISLSGSTTSISITPTSADSTAQISFIGSIHISGTAKEVALAPGVNTISIVVASETGVIKTYTITATVEIPPDCKLVRYSEGEYLYDDGSGMAYYEGLYVGDGSDSAIKFDLDSITGTILDASLNVVIYDDLSHFDTATFTKLVYNLYKVTDDTWVVGTSFPARGDLIIGGIEDSRKTDYVKSFNVKDFMISRLATTDKLCSFILGSPTTASYVSLYDASIDLTYSPYLYIRFQAIDKTSASFVNTAPSDIIFNITVTDTLSSIVCNGATLTSGSDYSVVGSAVTIKKEYLATLASGNYDITVNLAESSPQTIALSVINPPLSTACDVTAVTTPSGTLTVGTDITLGVDNTTTSVTVAVTVSADATWKLYSNAGCTSEISDMNMNLTVGTNIAYIKVTAENGTTTKIYTLTVTRAASIACDLTAVTTPSGAMTVGTNITANVTYAATSLTVAATSSADATWKLYSDAGCIMEISDKIMSLSVGENIAYLKVTAQDGTTTKTYTLTVTRATSTSCDVTAVTTPSGTTTIGTDITLGVDNAMTSINVAVTVSADATWKLYSNAGCTTEISDKTMSLLVGVNIAYIKVTAQDGTTTKTYTLTVSRAGSSACDVTAVTTPSGTLTAGTDITLGVDKTTTSVTVAVTVSADATWKLYSNAGCTTEISDKIMNLTVGGNIAYIKVTAENGTTTKTYTLTVTRAASTVCDLTAVTTPSGATTVGTNITAGVTYATTSLTVAATVSADATWKLYSDAGCITEISDKSMSLSVGANIAYLKVTAQDGTTTKTYTLTVTRATSTSCDVTAVTTPSGTTTIGTDITLGVDNAITSINVAVIISADATWKLYSNAGCTTEISDKTMSLIVGANIAYIKVSAQDGTTTKTYMLTVSRAGSSACDVTAVTSPSGTLTAGTDITLGVDNTTTSVTVAVTVSADAIWKLYSNAGCTTEINNKNMNLTIGTNIAYIKVTAENGTTTKTYTLTVTRAASSACDVTVMTTPSGSTTVGTNITANVTYATTSLTVAATVSADATWKLYSDAICSLEIVDKVMNLTFGSNTTYIKVISQDGATTKIYNLKITRDESTACDVTAVTTPVGAVITGTDITAAFVNTVTSVTVTAKVSEFASWKLYSNSLCTIEIADKTMSLSFGLNTAYIKVTAQNGTTKIYTVKITRREPETTPIVISTPTPSPTPTPGVQKITIDVKDGDSEGIVSQITVERSTDTKGTTTDTVTYEIDKVTETIEKLKEEGKKEALIVISDTNKEVFNTNVNLPANAMSLLADEDISLAIETKEAKIDLSKETIKKISEYNTQDTYFNMKPVDNEEEEEIVNRAKFEIGIQVNSGTAISVVGIPMTIETNMPSAEVYITLPLTGIQIPMDVTERDALLANLAIYIEHNDGENEMVRGELVIFGNGYGLRFRITKFSTFTIVMSDEIKSNACMITKVTVPKNVKVSGTTLSLTVKNKTTKVRIALTISKAATWNMYSDRACTKQIINRTLTLKEGSNKAYIKVTAEDGTTFKIYTLNIKRSKAAAKKVFFIASKKGEDTVAGEALAKRMGGTTVLTGILDKDAKIIISYVTKKLITNDFVYIIGMPKDMYATMKSSLNNKGYKNVVLIDDPENYKE